MLLATVIGGAAGVLVGVKVQPRFTSTTQLLVGSPNATVDAVPGFAQATQSLASSYSRAAHSSLVLAPVARRLRRPLAAVAAEVSVTPVPNSNIITVYATATSGARAQTLARAVSAQIRTFVRASQAQAGSAASLLSAYRSAARLLVVAQERLRRLRAHHVNPGSGRYTTAQTALAVAQLRTQALSTEYSSTVQDDAAAAGISVLSAPTPPTSNRASTTEKTGIVGLVAGLLLGALLAFVLEGRRDRRRLRRVSPY